MWCAYAQVTKRPREAQDSRSQCRKAWVEGSSDNGAPEARTSYILADCAALPALHLFSPSDPELTPLGYENSALRAGVCELRTCFNIRANRNRMKASAGIGNLPRPATIL